MVNPVRSSEASVVLEVIVSIAHRVVSHVFWNSKGFSVISVQEKLVNTVGIDAGRSPGEFVSWIFSLSQSQSSEFFHGELLVLSVVVFVAGLEGIVDVKSVDEIIDLHILLLTSSRSFWQSSGRTEP